VHLTQALVNRRPVRYFPGETVGSPSFPGDPNTALPCSQTPGGSPRQTIVAFQYCPRLSHNEDSPDNPISGLYDTASRFAAYA